MPEKIDWSELREPYKNTPFSEPGCPDWERNLIQSLAIHINNSTLPTSENTPYGTAILKQPIGLSTWLITRGGATLNAGAILTRSKNPIRMIYPNKIYPADELVEVNKSLLAIGEPAFTNGQGEILLCIAKLLTRVGLTHDESMTRNCNLFWSNLRHGDATELHHLDAKKD